MEPPKLDRRVQLTNRMLREALVRLLGEQHISKISVRALCEQADINRSTFYLHYADPYDLLEKIKRQEMANLTRHLDMQQLQALRPPSAQVLARILDYCARNRALFLALLSDHCDFAFQKELMGTAQLLSERARHAPDARTQGYISEFATTGCVSVIHKWLLDGAQESPQHMAELIERMLFFGLNSLSARAPGEDAR